KAIQHPLHHARAEVGVAHVARPNHALGALFLHQAAGFFRVLGLFQVADGHLRTLAGEMQGHRTADAAVTAGDQRHLAFQPPGSAVAVADALGFGLHLVLVAGLAVLFLRWLAGIRVRVVHAALLWRWGDRERLHAPRT